MLSGKNCTLCLASWQWGQLIHRLRTGSIKNSERIAMHLSDWWYERIVVRFDSEPIWTHTPYCLRPLGPAPNYWPNNQYNQSVGYINMDNPILLLCLTETLYNPFHGILRAMYDGYWFICPQKKTISKNLNLDLVLGQGPLQSPTRLRFARHSLSCPVWGDLAI